MCLWSIAVTTRHGKSWFVFVPASSADTQHLHELEGNGNDNEKLAGINDEREQRSHIVFCGSVEGSPNLLTRRQNGTNYEAKSLLKIEWNKIIFIKMNVHNAVFDSKNLKSENSMISGVTCYETRQVARIVLLSYFVCRLGIIFIKILIKKERSFHFLFDK